MYHSQVTCLLPTTCLRLYKMQISSLILPLTPQGEKLRLTEGVYLLWAHKLGNGKEVIYTWQGLGLEGGRWGWEAMKMSLTPETMLFSLHYVVLTLLLCRNWLRVVFSKEGELIPHAWIMKNRILNKHDTGSNNSSTLYFLVMEELHKRYRKMWSTWTNWLYVQKAWSLQ